MSLTKHATWATTLSLFILSCGSNSDPGNLPQSENTPESNDSRIGERPDTDEGNDSVPDPEPLCEPLSYFWGQISMESEMVHSGGTPTEESLDFDGNLNQVYQRAKNETFNVSLEIEGIVTATNYADWGNRHFWIQDGNRVIEVYVLENPDDQIQVGMRVQFEATKLDIYKGHPQIREVKDFDVVGQNQDIPVLQGDDITFELDQENHIIKVSGEITEKLGACPEETRNKCYRIDLNNGKTVQFRSSKNVEANPEGGFVGGLEVGTCLTYVGPWHTYPGPLSDSASSVAQLNHYNFNWTHQRNQP